MRTQINRVAPKVGQKLRLVQLDDAHVPRVAVRGVCTGDGRGPNDVPDDPVVDVRPVPLQRRKETLELDDGLLRVVQVLLIPRQVRCRLMIAALRPRHVGPDILLYDDDSVVESSNQGLDGCEKVIKPSVAHEDDVPLRRGCIIEIRMRNEMEEINVYKCRNSRHRCLLYKGRVHDGQWHRIDRRQP